MTYKLDDGTAIIEVKVWNESDSMHAGDGPKPARKTPVEGDYARVWGRMKAFNNKRTVGAHVIRKIVDLNEVQHHLLEATAVHLYFARGPPQPKISKTEPGTGPGQSSLGGQQGGAPLGDMNGGGQLGRGLPHISTNARRVYEVLQTAPQNNEGLHYQVVAAQLGIAVNDVLKAGDELQSQSLIFSTVDDYTWAPLEA